MQKIRTGITAYRRWAARPVVAVALSLLACVTLPYLYSCLCEFVRTASFYYLRLYIEAHYVQIAFGAVVTALLFACITVLTARPWLANLAVGGLLCVAAWINRQKLVWRGDPLLPKDLVQASAAAGIAQEMHFSLGRETLVFMMGIAFFTALLLPARLPFGKGRLAVLARMAGGAALLGLVPAYVTGVLYDRTLMTRYHIGMSIASPADAYYRGSFVTSFCSLTQTLLPIEAPEGYNANHVQQALALLELPDTAPQRECDVFVVLLESYFFLGNYDMAEFSEPLTENFDRLAAEGVSGQMLSTGYGGGTANIEFSVLTGFSTRFLPTGSNPYMEYIREGFLAYPQFLKAQGYQTYALHPYIRTFYNRHRTYAEMGIDNYFAEEAFQGVAPTGNYVGEQDTFAKALALYHEATAADAPVFMHIVTMQNHIPNQPDEYPADYAVQASIPGESTYYNSCLTSVATSLRDIDIAMGEFVDALRQEDRDVIVLFFGDHQTNINGDEGEDLLSHMESYNALPAAEQTLRSHVTPYLMWANFDVKEQGVDGGLLPSHMLLPVLLNEYNVMRPAWMDWLLATEPYLGDLDYDLYFTGHDSLLAKMTDEQRAVYQAQELLQYDLMFGQKYTAPQLYPDTP